MDTYEACDAEAKRIGIEIANTFLAEWDKITPKWENVKLSGTASAHVDLPMRDSMPTSLNELEQLEKCIKGAENVLKEAMAIKETWHRQRTIK